MLEKIRQKWVEWLIGACIAVLTVVLTQHFYMKNNSTMIIQQQIDKKADKEYVDRQDENVKEQIQQHENSQVQLIRQMDAKYKSIDNKLDILIGKQK